MDNETLKEIKIEISAIRKVINSEFDGIGHAEDHIGLDLRLKHIYEKLAVLNGSLQDLKLLLILLIAVVFFK